jgi:uncharacterized membrane protein YdcZ (DUF606 family)
VDYGLSLSLTVLFGLLTTFQSAVIGAISRERGGREASVISPLGSLAVVAVLLLWIVLDEGTTHLPSPFDARWAIAAAVPVVWLGLWLAVRGLPPWYGTAGFAAGVGLVLTPRLIGDLGLAMYFSAFTFGGAAGALAFDHRGAFGTPQRSVSLSRAGGLALVGAGVILVRVS